MTISKRLRFEVLRRDRFTCYYCGRRAPHVEITLDHVNPRALGGGDTADNLVAACVECNGGKTSVPPDAELVENVSAVDLAFQDAMDRATSAVLKNIEREKEACAAFKEAWERWRTGSGDTLPLPDWWERPIRGLWRRSVRWGLIGHAIKIAMQSGIAEPFPYFLGVIKKSEAEVVDIASGLFHSLTEEIEDPAPSPDLPEGWGELCVCGRRKVATPSEDLPV